MLNIVAFNGSARPNGNTSALLNQMGQVLNREGIGFEIIQLAGKLLHGCTGCRGCVGKKRCIQEDDELNTYVERMMAADGIILASPVYFADVTSELKALIDRAGYVGKNNGGLYRRKLGAAVVAVRRAGAIHAFDTINHFFLIQEMIIPGSNYWNIGIGREAGSVAQDAEGMATMTTLGENLAWLLKQLHQPAAK